MLSSSLQCVFTGVSVWNIFMCLSTWPSLYLSSNPLHFIYLKLLDINVYVILWKYWFKVIFIKLWRKIIYFRFYFRIRITMCHLIWVCNLEWKLIFKWAGHVFTTVPLFVRCCLLWVQGFLAAWYIPIRRIIA